MTEDEKHLQPKSSPFAVRVVLDTPANQGLFDYSVPADIQGKLQPGDLVIVPFGKTVHAAVVWECDVTPDVEKLRPIEELADPVPVLTKAQMALAEHMAQRAMCTIGEFVNVLLTERIRKISQAVYQLLEIPLEKERMALPGLESAVKGRTKRQKILDLFQENNGKADEKLLNKTFGRNVWRYEIGRMIKSGMVVKTHEWCLPMGKVKMIRTVGLSEDRTWAESADYRFSRVKTVSDRRRSVMDFLLRAGVDIPVSDVLVQTDTKINDLNALSAGGIICFGEREVLRNHQHTMTESLLSSPVTLTSQQSEAIREITTGLCQDVPPDPVLLYGVTGSGKTEVYIQSAAAALSKGKQVLVLVPEISLTPQILYRFESRFPGLVGVYHSKLSEGERYDTWRCGRDGQYRIIIGPRSSLAVPLSDLGLIIVDECHEDSYYQTESVPYFSAVYAAVVYGQLTRAQVVLGSATPTVSQMFKAERSKWRVLVLPQRATGVSRPQVSIVDMRTELKAGNRSIFSHLLQSEIRNTLDAEKQVILFLNRRGAAAYSFCHFCGHEFNCPRCEIPLTWHSGERKLVCHFCGERMELPEVCPLCGKREIRQFGAGVEQVETLIRQLFPDAAVLRMDADTTAAQGSHEALLTQFANHEANILIGTQMVAKGLDFPDVRLVGIILADVGSNFHDYRVDEHTFQMLMQVSGRAGRAREQGVAIIQTFQPERSAIRAAAAGSYDQFYQKEIAFRKRTGYPPYSRMIRLEFRGKTFAEAEEKAFQFSDAVRAQIRKFGMKATYLIGPAPCYFPKINNAYRWHIILRGPNPGKAFTGMDLNDVRVEVDPPSLL